MRVVFFRPIDYVVCDYIFGVLNSVVLDLSVVMAPSDGSAGVTQEGVHNMLFLTFSLMCSRSGTEG